VTAPVCPRPYRRPRRAGAFRGPILLQPRSTDRGKASVLGTARSCDPGSSHPPAAVAAGSFAYLTKPVSAQRRPGTEPESDYLYARFCDSPQVDSWLWCIPEWRDGSSGHHLAACRASNPSPHHPAGWYRYRPVDIATALLPVTKGDHPVDRVDPLGGQRQGPETRQPDGTQSAAGDPINLAPGQSVWLVWSTTPFTPGTFSASTHRARLTASERLKP
jgi:hypothetical protein